MLVKIGGVVKAAPPFSFEKIYIKIYMSQAKKTQKMQVGGRFRMNGRELEGQLALDRLASAYASSGARERGMWDVAQRAIQDGHVAQYNANNSIQVFDADGNDITRKYTNTKAGTEDRWLKRAWDATVQNESDGFKRSGRYMSMVDMSPEAEKTDSTSTNRKKLRRGDGWWTYDKDKKYVDDFSGRDKHAIIKEIRAYFDDADRDTLKDRYDLSGWNEDQMNTFRSDYDALENKNEFWNNLDAAIRSNNLTPYQKTLLQSWGFNDGVVTGSGADSGDGNNTPTVDPNWKGNADRARARGVGIRKRSDGRWEVYGDNDFTNGTWYLKGFDFVPEEFQNGFLHNGIFYTQDEALDNNGTNYDLYNAIDPWISAWNSDASYNDRWNAAKATGVRFLGDDYNIFQDAIDPTKSYSEFLSRWFADNNYTGDYSVIDATNGFLNTNGNTIYTYLDNKNRGNNPYGIDDRRFLVKDAQGNITAYDDLDALRIAGFTINNSRRATPSRKVQANDYTTLRDGKDYAVYRQFTAGNQTNTIYVGRDGFLYWGRKNDRGEDMAPKRIYDTAAIDVLRETDFKDIDKVNKLYNRVTLNPSWFGSTNGMILPVRQWRSNRAQSRNPSRYQWGGSLGNVRSTSASESIADAKTDITNWHAIDGTEGGLTAAEWTKIGAAVGDLAGVGLTFVPGAGNIAGAVTGSVASIANFAADKEMGKSGAGKRLVTGLALDAASLIPLLGTGAKAAKAANTIRNLGSTAIRLLSLAGASAPIITVTQRIINGEKYTSRDLAEAISGLGSAAIAVKSHADWVGDSKLAKQADAAKFAESNTHLNDVKKTTITGKDGKSFIDESTPESIANFVKDNPTKSQAIKAIQATASEKQVELSATQAEDALKKLGITFDKGKLNWKPWGNKKNNTTWMSRQEGNASYIAPKEQQTGNLFSYMMLPRRRSNAFKSMEISADEINAAIGRLRDGFKYRGTEQSRLIDEALLRQTAYNPQAFGDLFRNGEAYRSTQYDNALIIGGRRYYRTPVIKPSRTIDMDAYWNSAIPATPVGRFRSPYMVDMPFSTARTYGNGQTALEYLAFKKGGKIIKAQPGTSIPEWRRDPNITYNTNGQPISIYGFPLNGWGMIWPQTGSETIEETPPATKPVTGRKPVAKTAVTKTNTQAGTQATAQTTTSTVETPAIQSTTNTQFTTNTQQPTFDRFWRPQMNLNFNSGLNNARMPGIYNWKDTNAMNTQVFGTPIIKHPDGTISGNAPTFTTTYHLGNSHNPNDVVVPFVGNKTSSGQNEGEGGGDDNDKKRKSFAGGLWEDLKANAGNMLNFADVALASKLILNNELRNSLKSHAALGVRQFQAPQMAQAVKNFGDIYQKFASVREPLLNAKNVSSDGHANVAFNLGRAERLADINRQEGAEISARNSQIDETNRQIGNYNTEQNVNTANLKSQYYTNWKSQRPLIVNNAIENWHSKVWQPYSYQNRQNIQNEQNANAQLDYESALRTAQLNARAKFDAKMAPYKDQWMKSDEYKNTKIDFEDWMTSDVARAKAYNDEYKTMQNSIYSDTINQRRNLNWWQGAGWVRSTAGAPGVAYAKNGGKTKYHREATEELAINTSKHAQQSAQKLSDNLVRLLMQLMKIK